MGSQMGEFGGVSGGMGMVVAGARGFSAGQGNMPRSLGAVKVRGFGGLGGEAGVGEELGAGEAGGGRGDGSR